MRVKWKDVAAKRGEAVHLEETLDMSSYVNRLPDIQEIRPVQAEFSATYTSGLVEVKGNLHTELILDCSKCLRTFATEMDIPFHALYSNVPLDSGDEEEDHVHVIVGDEIDLWPETEQTFLLAIPYIPVCNENCQGLCSVCGVDRNSHPCSCKQEKIDPRLAGLADFFNKQ